MKPIRSEVRLHAPSSDGPVIHGASLREPAQVEHGVPDGPELTEWFIGPHRAEILVWSPEAWAKLKDRPKEVAVSSKGLRVALRFA